MQDNLTEDHLPDIPDNNFFEFIVNTTKKTVRQEDALIRQILYTGFSAFTNDPINLGIMAPTSEGKTYPIMETFQFFPNDTVWNIGGMSTKVLVRQKGILVDGNNEPIAPRVLELKQKINGEKDDAIKDELKEQLLNLYADSRHLIDLDGKILVFLEPPQAELWNLIKPILSHDNKEITYDYVDNEKKRGLEGSKVQKVIVRGFPACIFCSAKDESHWSTWSEIQSRFLITSPNMTRQKYEESNLLIAQRKGLPSMIQEQIIVSYRDIGLAKQCVSYLIQGLKKSLKNKNDIWIPYGQILAEALKADKGTDVRNTKRIFSLLNIIPLVKSDTRPKLMLKGSISTIASLEDLSEVLVITQNLNGLPKFKMLFFKDVFCSLYKKLHDEDEKLIGLTTKQLREEFKLKTGKAIPTDSLRKLYLYELINNGLIDEENSADDKREKLYYPIVSLDVDSSLNEEKCGKYGNQSHSHNFSQHSPILLPKNCKLPDENWLIFDILGFVKCGIDLEDISFLDKFEQKISIKQFVEEYEKHVSLIPYFQSAISCNTHEKIFADIIYLGDRGNKDVKNCGNDSESRNSHIFNEDSNDNIDTVQSDDSETDEYSNLNLEEMKFEPLSNILKKEIPVSNIGLKPVEGVSFVCPDCKGLVFDNEEQRKTHQEKCPANKKG